MTSDLHLSPNLSMDAVTLKVGDLDAMTRYYTESMGLVPIEERSYGKEVRRVLGRGTTPLVRFIHTPDLPGVDPREPGLYHTAFLFEDQGALSAAVYASANHPSSRFVGSADHLVSEAFYFTDPEGNGIELYVDRPRNQWTYRAGQVDMATLYLDPNAYLAEHLSEYAVASMGTQTANVGHVHLQVGDVSRARSFYVDALGFEPTAEGYPGALFASAGGYHHHVAMNTWHSRGSGPRAARLGLGDVAITLPERSDLEALTERLQNQGIAYHDTGASVVTEDPWGTQVTLALPNTSAEDLLER